MFLLPNKYVISWEDRYFRNNIIVDDHKHLLRKVKDFVKDFFHKESKPEYVYHDLGHTRDVVDAAEAIINHYHLTDTDHLILFTSAWFHDTGYFIDPTMHEVKGAELAAKFLADEKVDAAIIEKVKSCIMATRLPQNPKTLIEEILCDADLFHFGNENFNKKNKLMHEEYNNLHAHKVSEPEWQEKTIALLESHHYYTDYCKLLLSPGQEKNIKKLKHKLHRESPMSYSESEPQEKTAGHKGEPKIVKKDRPEKGIETMFRISSNNHSRLSDMADNKAHILITVNSIILSAIISLVLRKLDNNAYLTIPSFILLAVSLTTMVFSILATRPTIPNGHFSQTDLAEKKINLLFFGNFYKMTLDEYRDAMLKVMDDSEFLYDNLIRDVYSQGVVLGRKYQLLRIAYNIFMYGLIVAVLAFIIASATAHPTPRAMSPQALIPGFF